MKIHGLQKMTLLDFPEHVACTVFLGGCDFRCPFCHNYELADGTAGPVMDEQELLRFLEKRTGLLDGVAFTGGEPLLHKDLPELLGRIRAYGFSTKIDTNGYHPQRLREILDQGLADYVAMDIKNSPGKYALTAGLAHVDMEKIRQSVSVLLEGSVPYEFRTTVVKEFHEAEDFRGIGELIGGARKYFLQCFTDRDSVPFEGLNAPSAEDLREYARIAGEYVQDVQIRGL